MYVSNNASLVAQMVKNLPAVQETWFDPWVRKIPLEKEMATHSSILAWKNPWMEEPGKLQSMDMLEHLQSIKSNSFTVEKTEIQREVVTC